MINKLSYTISGMTEPYGNLALEEYLLTHVKQGECILYLWQNRRTVVIGRNQNCWKECRVEKLESDGGYLARRLSGGGAVYHDLGNLNFTFLVRTEDYKLDKQMSVVLTAVRELGINAGKTGRNDITIDGKKFSGNAFYRKGDYSYHHGTIMVNVDIAELSKYLNVSGKKLRSNGVDSVKARVANLSEYRTSLRVEELEKKLIEAFGKVYGKTPEFLPASEYDETEIAKLTEKYRSKEWKYDRKIPFEIEWSRWFAWGGVTLAFQVDKGTIRDCAVHSDSMRPEIIEEIRSALFGCPYSRISMVDRVAGIPVSGTDEKQIVTDVGSVIAELF